MKQDVTIQLKTAISRTISKTHTAYRLSLFTAFAEAGIDITPDMYLVLRCLWEQDGRNQQELADDIHKDKASLTKLIDNLEKRTLVARITDPADRRNKRIFLTKAGKQLKEKVQPIALSVIRKAEMNIDKTKLVEIQEVLEQIYENIRRQ